MASMLIAATVTAGCEQSFKEQSLSTGSRTSSSAGSAPLRPPSAGAGVAARGPGSNERVIAFEPSASTPSFPTGTAAENCRPDNLPSSFPDFPIFPGAKIYEMGRSFRTTTFWTERANFPAVVQFYERAFSSSAGWTRKPIEIEPLDNIESRGEICTKGDLVITWTATRGRHQASLCMFWVYEGTPDKLPER
jgi:hypothetical protein